MTIRFARLRDGTLVTPHNLPPLNVRWTRARKAIVVAAVRVGMLSLEDAARRYEMSPDELAEWQALEEFN